MEAIQAISRGRAFVDRSIDHTVEISSQRHYLAVGQRKAVGQVQGLVLRADRFGIFAEAQQGVVADGCVFSAFEAQWRSNVQGVAGEGGGRCDIAVGVGDVQQQMRIVGVEVDAFYSEKIIESSDDRVGSFLWFCMQSGHFWLLDMSSVNLFLTVFIYS